MDWDLLFWLVLIPLIAMACFLSFILGIMIGLGSDDTLSIESHHRYLKKRGVNNGRRKSKKHHFWKVPWRH